jgi:Flp pilus assembly protein TadB
MAGAAAAGATPQQALLEVLAEEADAPLAWHLRRATRDLDPQAGLTDRSFLQVIASLNEDLGSPSFTLAAQAIGAGVRLGVPLAESLEHIASLAHEDIAFRAEARADFAYTHGAALLVFSLPPLLTLALHWLEPASVALAYSGAQGWAVAGALAAVCVVGYRTVTAGERRATRRVGGGRAP